MNRHTGESRPQPPPRPGGAISRTCTLNHRVTRRPVSPPAPRPRQGRIPKEIQHAFRRDEAREEEPEDDKDDSEDDHDDYLVSEPRRGVGVCRAAVVDHRGGTSEQAGHDDVPHHPVGAGLSEEAAIAGSWYRCCPWSAHTWTSAGTDVASNVASSSPAPTTPPNAAIFKRVNVLTFPPGHSSTSAVCGPSDRPDRRCPPARTTGCTITSERTFSCPQRPAALTR